MYISYLVDAILFSLSDNIYLLTTKFINLLILQSKL